MTSVFNVLTIRRVFFPSIPICPVPETRLTVEGIKDPSTIGRSKCYDAQCSKKRNVETCEGVVSCGWCVMDEQSQPLTKAYCTDINLCYGGQKGKLSASLFGLRNL